MVLANQIYERYQNQNQGAKGNAYIIVHTVSTDYQLDSDWSEYWHWYVLEGKDEHPDKFV